MRVVFYGGDEGGEIEIITNVATIAFYEELD